MKVVIEFDSAEMDKAYVKAFEALKGALGPRIKDVLKILDVDAAETQSGETADDTNETEIVDPGADDNVSDDTQKSYFDREFKGIRSNFEGKLRNHIKNRKIKEATEEDLRALRGKWATNQETKDKACPLDDIEPSIACICPPRGMAEGDEMNVRWCVPSCFKFPLCDVAKEKALSAGIWKPDDLA